MATLFACNKDDDGIDPYDPDAIRTIKLSLKADLGTIQFDFEDEDEDYYENISFPTDLLINWGDGSMTSSNSHYYDNSGTYNVTIQAKNLKWFELSGYNGCSVRTIDFKDCNSLLGIELYNKDLTSLDVSNLKALTYLDCYDNDLTSLDVSGLKALEHLECDYNDLTSLDIKGCPSLIYVSCSNNDLSAEALNKIFNDLPQSKPEIDEYGDETYSIIYFARNPGSNTCDKSIAEKKGWKTNSRW